MEKNDEITRVIDKEIKYNIFSLIITVVAPIVLNYVNFRIWISCASRDSDVERLHAFTTGAALTGAAALIAVALIVLLNVQKYKAAKEFGAMSRSAATVNVVTSSLVILIPLASMDYSVFGLLNYRLNGGAGHSAGAELFIPIFLYLVLISPSIIPQVINHNKTVYKLKSMMANEINAEL